MPRKIPLYAVHCFNDYRPPIALGLIVANIKHNFPEIANELDFSPGYSCAVDDLWSTYRTFGPGIFLFSDYHWNVNTHLSLSCELKQHSPANLIVHGGSSVPRYEEPCRTFLLTNPQVDFVGHGEGEDIIADLLAAYLSDRNYERVAGLGFLRDGEVVRTGKRERRKDLDHFPSPYLTGEFDRIVASNRPPAVTIETTRGCPYMCTFCDWGQATLQRLHEFSIERVRAEIEWMARHEVPVIELADSNFGILDRDVELARHLCDVKQKTGFPRELATSYAKNATTRVTEIVRLARDAGLVAQGILSIQTRDEGVLTAVRRKNLPPKRYDALLADFRSLKLPVLTEIMVGLPGSTYQTLKNDLDWACERNIGVYVHATIMLPNTPMADPSYIEQYKIRTVSQSRFADPAYLAALRLKPLRGNQVVATSTYDEDDYYRMMRMMAAFHMFQGESVLKHIMFFLKWEHGISQVEFLDQLLASSLAGYPRLLEFREGEVEPASTIAFVGSSDPLWDSVAAGSWPSLYADVERYIADTYGITRASAQGFDTVMRVQQFVMASYTRRVPDHIELDHDFASYFHDIINGKRGIKLSDYPPATLTVSDPLDMCNKPERPEFYELHVGHIELASELTPTRIGFDVREVLGRPPAARTFELAQ